MPNAARLRIALIDVDSQPWRRIEVPLSLSLRVLHDSIQAAFQWTNSHLWEFSAGDQRYSDFMEDNDWSEEPVIKAGKTSVGAIVKSGVTEFLYVYDFGDDWVHLITIEELFDAAPATKYPRYVDGQLAAPPDDCGGPPGFEMFRDMMASPGHPEHAELLDWYGGPFDPADVEEEQIVTLMKRIANRRRKKP